MKRMCKRKEKCVYARGRYTQLSTPAAESSRECRGSSRRVAPFRLVLSWRHPLRVDRKTTTMFAVVVVVEHE